MAETKTTRLLSRLNPFSQHKENFCQDPTAQQQKSGSPAKKSTGSPARRWSADCTEFTSLGSQNLDANGEGDSTGGVAEGLRECSVDGGPGTSYRRAESARSKLQAAIARSNSTGATTSEEGHRPHDERIHKDVAALADSWKGRSRRMAAAREIAGAQSDKEREELIVKHQLSDIDAI